MLKRGWFPCILAFILTGCGVTNSTSPSAGSSAGYGGTQSKAHEVANGLASRGSICRSDQFVGNRRSKALHPPGDHNLPAPRNQVCFNSAQVGESVGYHLVGTGYRKRHTKIGAHRHRLRGGTAPSVSAVAVPGRPRPREETFHGCPPAGTQNGDQLLNLLKNRIDPALQPVTMSLGSFMALTWPRQVSDSHIPRRDWTRSERNQTNRYEGMAVRLQGFLVHLKQEGPESPNCEGAAGIDWHLWLGMSKQASLSRSLIVESTPRIRDREHGFNFNVLAGLLARGIPIRITGWTMLDYEHPEQLRSSRATLWELHPITRIEALRLGQWVTVAGP